ISPTSPSIRHYPTFFLFTRPSTPEIYTLSLHDALPISKIRPVEVRCWPVRLPHRIEVQAEVRRPLRHSAVEPTRGEYTRAVRERSEEHTSELQSPYDLVCRLLLEKKKKNQQRETRQYCE